MRSKYILICTCAAAGLGMLSCKPFVVTHAGDDGPGSLRDAIVRSNNAPGRDKIRFAIPGKGPHVIMLASPLPDITDPVHINGSTQVGGAGNIIIDGSQIDPLAGADGLRIVDTDGSMIKGLVVQGFAGGVDAYGIQVLGASSANKVSHNLLFGNVNGIGFTDGATGNKAIRNFVDAEVGELWPEGGDPTTDTAFRDDRRRISGADTHGIIMDRGAHENDAIGNHVQRTTRGIAMLNDANRNRVLSNTAQTHGNQCYLAAFNADENVISYNTCDLPSREGIETFGEFGGGGTAHRNVISHNVVTRGGYFSPEIGQIFIGGNANENVAEHNTLVNNYSHGIYLFEGAVGNYVGHNTVDGCDRAGINAFAGEVFAVLPVSENVLEANVVSNYARVLNEGGISIAGNAHDNVYQHNTIGETTAASGSAIRVIGFGRFSATHNLFVENTHERTDLLWFFNGRTANNTVCGPVIVNGELDLDTQLSTPDGLGNVVLETCNDLL